MGYRQLHVIANAVEWMPVVPEWSDVRVQDLIRLQHPNDAYAPTVWRVLAIQPAKTYFGKAHIVETVRRD